MTTRTTIMIKTIMMVVMARFEHEKQVHDYWKIVVLAKVRTEDIAHGAEHEQSTRAIVRRRA